MNYQQELPTWDDVMAKAERDEDSLDPVERFILEHELFGAPDDAGDWRGMFLAALKHVASPPNPRRVQLRDIRAELDTAKRVVTRRLDEFGALLDQCADRGWL